jgi:hypothetical protein
MLCGGLILGEPTFSSTQFNAENKKETHEKEFGCCRISNNSPGCGHITHEEQQPKS